MRLVSALQLEPLTSAQIAALATGTGRYPKGSAVFDTTLNQIRINTGTDSVQAWLAEGLSLIWDSVEAGVSLPAASITTPTLPGTFKHLRVVAQNVCSIANSGLSLRLNGDSGANYNQNQTQAHGTTIAPADQLAGTSFNLGNIGSIASQPLTVEIPNYCDQSGGLGKSLFSSNGFVVTSLSAGNLYLQSVAGFWNQNAAITTLTFLAGNFAAGTRITVYGEA